MTSFGVTLGCVGMQADDVINADFLISEASIAGYSGNIIASQIEKYRAYV